MKRRSFLTVAAGAAAAMGAGVWSGRAESPPRLRKALLHGMLPPGLPDEEKFALARRCGFEGLEGAPMADPDAARVQADLARAHGVPIHSLCFGWAALNDPRPEVVEQGLRGVEAALRQAAATGAGTVLLVPAIVTDTLGYAEAYERSQAQVRKLIPLAEDVKVTIAIENVWNRFLLSPLEFARYIDEIGHPRVRAYFDVGNVIVHGFAQDWIRVLNRRIVRVHLKDFRRKDQQWTNLGEGDVNWPEVRRALDEIGYEGYVTPELAAGDEPYLADVSRRIDRLLGPED